MKRLLLETSFSKIYMIIMILITLLIIGGYFSYALFTVTKEKNNVISIVTGSLDYHLTVDGEETNSLSVPANSSKDFVIELSNPNDRIARFNFYYLGNIKENIYLGYVNKKGYNVTPNKEGINLEKINSSGSSNTYLIRISNYTSSSFSIELVVEVGLDYNDLTIPSEGKLFTEYPFLTAVEVVKSKANSESLRYMDATEEQRKEAWEHTHPITEQTEALTDYRYVGSNPNNYVRFNNETWRIIGVFTVDDGTGKKEERLKIIRDKSIGNYAWDNKDTNTGADNNYGSNNWTNARLNYLLNPGHEDENIGGSLYWNSKSGKCYYGEGNTTVACDFTDSGLKEEARSMIGDTLWYLGSIPDYVGVSIGLLEHFYTYERRLVVRDGYEPFWIGKVGLMYPSDYGYATSGDPTTDRIPCLNKELVNWGDSNYSYCKNNDWLYNSDYKWTISPFELNSFSVLYLHRGGSIYNDTVSWYNSGMATHPVVFLKSNVKITSGNGSIGDMYQLLV